MSQLFGMWYARLFPTYHGLQSMSVLTFLRFRTAALYDFAVTSPFTLMSAAVANLPTMKPISLNACRSIFGAYFVVIARYSTMSGVVSVRLLNSLLTCILPSNWGNCFAMNSLAIGVEEPHSTLSTRPCEIAACSSAGAESG